MKGALGYLQGWSDLAICCRLIIATFLGSMIGWERISKRHNAGIRTFALVSLGAAVSTALNIKLGYIPGLEADVSRIPAGVISGIGFLGAGSILTQTEIQTLMDAPMKNATHELVRDLFVFSVFTNVALNKMNL